MQATVILLLMVLCVGALPALEFGALPVWELGALSASMMIPIKGTISEMGLPVALRNLDFNFLPFMGLSTSIVLYNIQGLGATGFPSEEPIFGPSYVLLGNLCLKLTLPIDFLHITAKGGGFAFYSVNPALLTGNIERAIADDRGWDTASVDMSFQNTMGFGYLFGGSVTLYIIEELAGLFLEVLYYDGEAPLGLSGKVTGTEGGTVVADDHPIEYPNSKIDFSGIEITLGITIIL